MEITPAAEAASSDKPFRFTLADTTRAAKKLVEHGQGGVDVRHELLAPGRAAHHPAAPRGTDDGHGAGTARRAQQRRRRGSRRRASERSEPARRRRDEPAEPIVRARSPRSTLNTAAVPVVSPSAGFFRFRPARSALAARSRTEEPKMSSPSTRKAMGAHPRSVPPDPPRALPAAPDAHARARGRVRARGVPQGTLRARRPRRSGSSSARSGASTRPDRAPSREGERGPRRRDRARAEHLRQPRRRDRREHVRGAEGAAQAPQGGGATVRPIRPRGRRTKAATPTRTKRPVEREKRLVERRGRRSRISSTVNVIDYRTTLGM